MGRFSFPQLPELGAEQSDGQLMAAYQALDGRTRVLLLAYRAALDLERAEEVAPFWVVGGLGGESEVRFTPLPREGLTIRCTRPARAERGTDAAVCLVEGPDVAVVLTSNLSESRTADLVAEAHRKLTG